MQVTVSGGIGHGAAALNYSASDIAYNTASALAAVIDNTYSRAIYYDPANPPLTPSSGYLIVGKTVASNTIHARGFGAIIDENTGEGSTIRGGDDATGQIVLASNGGLTFTAHSGATTVVAGGGDNHITFAGSKAASAAYTSSGNDTIIGGDGNTTVAAGAGFNTVILGAGNSLVGVSGTDSVKLGAGSDTIDVLGGSAHVLGAGSVSGGGYSLTFVGGNGPYASTVAGGAGSYDIMGGAGGGVFHGGLAGNNLIAGGAGAVTIVGGGAGDTLEGGAGNDSIFAAHGNETLLGGAGNNVFGLTIHNVANTGGLGTTDVINDFNGKDLLSIGGVKADNYAINTYKLTSAGGTFFLEDGTKVVLKGFHQQLSSSAFKH